MKKIIALTVVRPDPIKILSAKEYEWTVEGHSEARTDAGILLHRVVGFDEQGMIGRTEDGFEVHLQVFEV